MKKRISKLLGVGLTLALLSSLALVVPASAVSSASVVLSNPVISQTSNYTITFDVVSAVPDTGVITIQFPVGTSIAALADGDISIQSTAGFGTAISENNLEADPGENVAVTAGTTTAGPIVAITIDVTGGDLPNGIGEGATVRIKFKNTKITNPSTIASDYTLTVKTDQVGDTTAVASQPYALSAPTVLPLPGIVQIYNPSGILMNQFTGGAAIQNALNAAGPGYRVDIGPGTYGENPNMPAGFTGMSIKATGSAAQTVVTGNWTVDEASTTIEGLTLIPANPGPTVTVTGDKSVITGCVFGKSGTATTTLAENFVTLGVAVPTGAVSVTNCSFDTTLGDVTDTALVINQNWVTVTDCTFLVDTTLAGVGDTAITVNGGIAAAPVTISGVTVTGSSGIGILGTAGLATITGTTLDTLDPAMNLVAGTYTVTDSTITNSGTAVSTTVPAGRPAINVADAGVGTPPTLTINNSTITGCPNDILEVDPSGTNNASLITLMWNDLSGNTLGIDNNATVGTVNAMVNWWGDPTGPAGGFNGGLVNTSGALGMADTTGTMVQGAAATSLMASTTFGVSVQPQTATGAAWAPAAGDFIGVGKYAGNPGEPTAQPALENGFYDVFFVNGSGALLNNVLIKFYNANITEDTVVMVWSDLQGAWSACSAQGVNLFSGFAWVNVTGTSIPSILDLSGTPFALTEPPAAPPAAPAVLTPAFGADEVDTKPTFTWTASAGATTYEFVLAEEIGQDDKFAIIDYSATTETHGHVAREELKYETTYNWRVRAVSDIGKSAWTTAFFTTEPEPEPAPEPTPPVVIEERPPQPAPEIILEIPPTEAPVQVIPDYLLWTVVGVGGVLVIAVIVLIVRTRRVT